MARPKRIRIDYFSFDVDFFEDEKIEPISGEFGVKGEIVVIKLLCAIYRNGYFTSWTEQLKMALANRCKVSHDLIDQIILRLVKYNFFDEDLFFNEKVISSKAIQRRFKEATRKRKIEYENLDFWLIFDEKELSSARNASASEFLPPETPQSKSKSKSKLSNNTNVLLQKPTNTREENLEEEKNQNSTFKNFQEEKEKSSAKKEKELESVKNFLVENGADYTDVSEWFRNRIEERKATTRYYAEKFILECKKNNISVKEGVYACAFNGWVNFNPQWVINQKESNSKSSKNGIKEKQSDDPNDPKVGKENLSAYEKLRQQMARG